jgi:pyrroline-5-carboxylate reductase
MNLQDVVFEDIYVEKNIFTTNKDYLNNINSLEEEKMTTQLFFYPEEYIIEKYVEKHRFFDNLKEKIAQLEKVNVFENPMDIINKVDILFIFNKKNFAIDVIKNLNKKSYNDFYVIILESNILYCRLEKIIKEIKIFKAELGITPINQFVGRLCYNKNVTENDYKAIHELLSTFGYIFNYEHNEKDYWHEILIV